MPIRPPARTALPACLAFVACAGLSWLAAAAQDSGVIDVWIGTSSAAPSRGIYHCTLNTAAGRLSTPELAAEIEGPGFLAMNPKETRLYAVGSLDGKPSVAAYRIVGPSGKRTLEFVNVLETGDGGAAHVAVDSTGRTLLTAQYGGGSVAVFSLNDDGGLNARTQIVEHQGASGADPQRQEAPHPHWVGFSPDNRFAFVPDLGLDQVVIYQVDAAKSQIERHGAAQVPRGSGPRHMKFHPSGKWVYVLNELTLSVSVFDYDPATASLQRTQTINTVPRDQLAKEQAKSASEIRVHPSGQFVYSANRGHDTITAFRVDQETGRLRLIEREPVRGATPRNFNLDPSGRWLLAAGQDSHTLAVFEIDQENGELAYNRSVVHAPSAICVLMKHE